MRPFLLVLAMLLLACGKSQSRDVRFVGEYRGFLEPKNNLFDANTAELKQMEARMLREMESDWKSGRSGLDLKILEDGNFTLRFWMPGPDGEGPTVPGIDHTSRGKWWNEGDVLVLRSDDFAPFFYTRVTKTRFGRATREDREKELQLKLEGNRLTNTTDLTFERLTVDGRNPGMILKL